MSRASSAARGAILTALLFLAAAALPSVSSADFGIQPGSLQVHAVDSSGNPDARAGAHPDRLVMDFNIETSAGAAARDLVFEFAPGLSGSPIATPTCPRPVYEFEDCPPETQVGKFSALFNGGENFRQPVFNITPAPDQLGAIAFKPFWETELVMSVRPDDFGLTIATYDMPQLPFNNGHVELWGIPADKNGAPPPVSGPPRRAAFLTMPTKCGPLDFTLRTREWGPAAEWVSETVESEPFTDCESLPFEPSLGLQLTSSKPDSPTGARIDLNLAEHNDPDERVSASLKDVKIDLPPGLTVSPAGVEGRETCSDEQFGLGRETPVTCPYRSRVGSVVVSTTQLASNLEGSIFMGRERPGERFRLFVAAAARGIQYKAVALLTADPQTGQLATALNDLPQFSIGQISLQFEGGPRALLATPLTCGPAKAHARFVPYSGTPAVDSSATVSIGSPCVSAPAFSPGLIAGSTDTRAAHSTAFALTLSREEGEQLPGKFKTTLPPGLSANMTAVDLCAAAAAAVGTCSDASRIGTAVGEVGSGPSPAKVPGAVYVTGPYKGAPFGLSIVFRAAIGPFDLGTLNVRATLALDPHTGQVTIEHVLPAVFEGVPLRFRTIGIDLTRPGFLVNPTSCEPMQLISTITSVDARPATVSDPFRVAGCGKLPFRPKVTVALNHRGRRAENPELSFTVKVPKRQANLRRFKVAFPRVLKFHNAGLTEICTRGAAAEGRCRPRSQVGTAVAISPLLGEPLRGPVYVVQPTDGGFPDLWSNVEGMGVKLRLKSESSGKNGSLVTEMVDLPDLPLSSFKMRVSQGAGESPLFSIGKRLCRGRGALASPVELEGHSGAIRAMKVQMKAGCPKRWAKRKRAQARRAHSRDR
jgi:hypothetical protein